MRHRFVFAVFSVAATLLAANANAATVFGRTSGQFGVDPTGGAQYSIPIWTQPGPAAVQPGLSLVYNSHYGNGVMGIGWTLGGLGSITRCTKTIAQDTTPAAVALVTSDGYCINGNRLRLTSGTYGIDGSTYQTELADFSLITAHGTAGNGPSYFSVQGRDGRTYDYGYTDTNGKGINSAVPASSTNATVIQWYLSKVVDRYGNNYVINYKAVQTGTTEPDVIYWTPTSVGASSYSYTMTFSYGSNPAQSSPSKYIGGTTVINSSLLSSIAIAYGSTVVKDYFLGYESATTTGRDRLKTISECADAAQATCFPTPTTITYQNGTAGIPTSYTTAASSTGSGLSARYDINGDGYPDLIYNNGTTTVVSFGSATGFGAPQSTGTTGAQVLIGNITGGAKDGLLAPSGGIWYYYSYNGSSFSAVSTGLAFDSTVAQFQLADIDGDGRADLVSLYTTYNSITKQTTVKIDTRLNTSGTGGPTFSSTLTTAYTQSNTAGAQLQTPDFQYNRLRRYDFDGDGRDDLALEVFTGGPNYTVTTYELISTGTAFTPVVVASGSSEYLRAFFANWNDDACTDFVYDGNLYMSGCNGSIPEKIAVGNVVAAMDWDGDGRTDLIVSNGTTLGVYLSTGAGISSLVSTSIPYTASCQYVTLDVNADGLDDLACWSAQTGGNGSFYYYTHSGADVFPDLATAFTDGYGVTFNPSYEALPVMGYRPGSSSVYPQQDYTSSMQAVHVYTATNGIGGTYSVSYGYNSAVFNLLGRGFEGFGSTSKEDSRNSVKEITFYSQTFPTTGMYISDAFFQPSGSQFSATTYYTTSLELANTANEQQFFPYYNYIQTKRYEVGGAEDGTLTSTSSINYNSSDNFGNFGTVETSQTDNDANSPYYNSTWTSTTTSTFTPDHGTNWCLALPSEVDVANTAPGVPSITRHTSYTPDYSYCHETGRVIEPSSSQFKVTEAYLFDSFGNMSTDTITGVGLPARAVNVGWGTTGQFAMTAKNPYSQTTTSGYDFSNGTLTSKSDPNGITTSWTYDPFFRKNKEIRPDSTSTTWAYNSCSGGCINGNNEMTVVRTGINTDNSVLATDYTYLDKFGRVLATSKPFLSNGLRDFNEVQYDSLGNIHQSAAPCTFGSCTDYWTVNAYDVLNRLTSATRPISATNNSTQSTIYAYQGRSTTVTDAEAKKTTTITKVTGSPGRTVDHNGYYVGFTTDAFGSVLSVIDSNSTTLQTQTYSYGLAAFPKTSTDVDLGARTYTYDALGEITAWMDAKGQAFSMTYDLLSRPYQRTEPDTASPGNSIVSTWTWGATASSYNIGKLASLSSTAAVGNYTDAYTYDSDGRLSDRTITLPTDGAHSFDYTYSTKTGLLDALLYPASASPGTYRLNARYEYGYGILEQIYDGAHTSTAWWGQSGTNSRGQATQETMEDLSGDPQIIANHNYDAVTGWLNSNQTGVGSGSALQNESYVYDKVGDVIQRQNNNAGLTENFTYDNLHRLQQSTLNGTQNLQMCYDNSGGSCTANLPGPGNITSRSDVASQTAWTYDTTHIHAVTQAGTGTGSYSYTYDANGNAISRNGLSYAWTSYNYPSAVSTATESASFEYAPDRSRWRMSYTGSAGLETTYYATPLFEKVISGGVTDFRHYIYANNKPVAVISRTSAGAITVRSLLVDQQGSVATIVTESTGAALANESFTAYGNRREASSWSGAPTSGELTTMNGVTREGYTFQTVLGSMGLNHMNGRIEDAITGRFLSPDPIISNATSTQSYDRYSYVNNNPLSYTDPTGFSRYSKCIDACFNSSSIFLFRPDGGGALDGLSFTDDSGDGNDGTSTAALTDWINDFNDKAIDSIIAAFVYPGSATSDQSDSDSGSGSATLPQSLDGIVVNASTGNTEPVFDVNSGSFACGRAGTCSWNMGSYVSRYSSNTGTNLKLTTSINLAGAQWIQTYIATGDPYDNGNIYTPDDWNADVFDNAWSPIYTGGGTTSNTFSDGPGRPVGTSGLWVAQASLIQANAAGVYSAVFTFTWGFSVSPTGQITQIAPMPAAPMAGQLRSIGGVNW